MISDAYAAAARISMQSCQLSDFVPLRDDLKSKASFISSDKKKIGIFWRVFN